MFRYFTLLILLISTSAFAQKELTLDNFYDGSFFPRTVKSLNWMNDGQFYTEIKDNNIIQSKVIDGSKVATIVKGDSLGIEIEDYEFNADETFVMILTQKEMIYRRSYTAEYYVYDLKNQVFSKLSENGPQSFATLSPDGKMVAFVRDNNIFVVRLDNMNESQITKDGEFGKIINGSADWVYEEEFSLTKSFFWSPDSKKIAYLRFDEAHVREYNLQKWNDGALYPEDYRFKYPKAGERNSIVDVYIHDVKSSDKKKIDLGRETDIYIPRIKWTKNPNLLSIQKLNRMQNQLDIIHADARTGSTSSIYTDKSKTYIDITYTDDLTYLENGTQFLYSSERDGYKHFYLHRMDGQLVNQVTKGKWEATEIVGMYQKSKTPTMYYMSTEGSPLERHFYKIRLDGKGKEKLSTRSGWNKVDMSDDTKYYVISHNSATSPIRYDLYQTSKNKLVKELQTNERLLKSKAEFNLSDKHFFQFETVDQTLLNGFFLYPPEFDSTKTYPLLLFQYSGPGTQVVTNTWSTRHETFHHLLTQAGYIVAYVDSRGMDGRGIGYRSATYKQMGKLELQDHIEAAKFFQKQTFVDKDRMGIWGWSYGGYMSSLVMMKAPEYFKAGIAVAPVTTWRYYDTVYTERYLTKPQDNPSGYDDFSPLTHAEKLKGKFLLVHGTGDDNVHFQNSVALQNKLINNRIKFESFYYPDKTHSIGGLKTRLHLYGMMFDFVTENL